MPLLKRWLGGAISGAAARTLLLLAVLVASAYNLLMGNFLLRCDFPADRFG